MTQNHRDYPASVKQQLTEQWTRRRLGRIDHEHRVAAIASILFDLTQSRHKLGLGEKRLLLSWAPLEKI